MMRVFQDPTKKPALAIISANSGDGKTYFSASLATVLSQLGGRTPLELIERRTFSVLIRELVNQFDYVIVDTPAGSYGSDASALAMKCGAALCVARHRNSKLLGLQELIATMSAGSLKLAGVI